MHIDYLSFTFKKPDTQILRDDDLIFIEDLDYNFNIIVETILQNCSDENIILRPCKAGLYNYKLSYDICIDRAFEDSRTVIPVGKLAHGGNAHSCYVQLSGKACSFFDLTLLHDFISSLNKIKITRIDIAQDIFNDVVGMTENGKPVKPLPFEYFVKQYKKGSFKCHKSRVNPKNQLIGDFLTKGCPSGRTLYVGDRKSPKFARIYEKGKESNSSDYPNWLRFEIEFKAVDKNVIPLHSLINFRSLFLNAYPICLDFDYPSMDVRLIREIRQTTDGIDLQIKNVQRQYGQFLYYLKNHTDIDLNKLIIPGINKKCEQFLLYKNKKDLTKS